MVTIFCLGSGKDEGLGRIREVLGQCLIFFISGGPPVGKMVRKLVKAGGL